MTKFIINFWRVGVWGRVRLPDGRDVFFPWLTGWMLVDVSGNPGNSESLLAAVLGILLGVAGLVVSIIYIRIKRRMPKQDFF